MLITTAVNTCRKAEPPPELNLTDKMPCVASNHLLAKTQSYEDAKILSFTLLSHTDKRRGAHMVLDGV